MTWSISHISDLPIESCGFNVFPEDKIFDNYDTECWDMRCGTDCRNQHHKNIDLNMDYMENSQYIHQPEYNNVLVLSSADLCTIDSYGNHNTSIVGGLSCLNSSRRVVILNENEEDSRRELIRAIQHEIGHNFGLRHHSDTGYPIDNNNPCVMSGWDKDYDEYRDYPNDKNFWKNNYNQNNVYCPRCTNDLMNTLYNSRVPLTPMS